MRYIFENWRVKLSNWRLSWRKHHLIDEDAFKDSDTKVSYYTGLNTWELLPVLFVFVKPSLICKDQASKSISATVDYNNVFIVNKTK